MSLQIDAPMTALPTAPAKLRILETADALFYDEGIRPVGVDRLIAEAKVTKATFYKHYGAKDRLVATYIGYRHRQTAEYLTALAAAADDPVQVLRGLQHGIIEQVQSDGFRGCPFINAAAEFSDPAHPVRIAVRDHRDWYNGVLEDLLRRAGHPLPGEGADELMLARDGAMTGGYAGDPVAATAALSRAFDRVIADTRR